MNGVEQYIGSAIEARLADALRPTTEACSSLRGALDEYEAAARTQARHEAVAAVLVALGQPAPEAGQQDLQLATETLRTALARVLALVTPALAPSSEPVCSSEPLPAFEAARIAPFNPARPRIADPVTIQACNRTLDEIDELDCAREPAIRLGHLLQALVAECRLYGEQLPSDHYLQDRLSGAVRYLSNARKQYTSEVFLRGLSYAHDDDWWSVARSARARVAKFDADANTPIVAKKSGGNGKKNGNGKTSVFDDSTPPPNIPTLQSRLSGRTLIMFGGSKRADKLRTLQQRFGLGIDWVESQTERDAIEVAKRIRGGSVGAVLVLEGFMSHANWIQVQDACAACSVPIAFGARGGVGSIATALVDLEKQCASGRQS